MEKLYTVVQMDLDTFDEKFKKVVELREQLLRALRELNNAVEDAPLLTLKEENPAPRHSASRCAALLAQSGYILLVAGLHLSRPPHGSCR